MPTSRSSKPVINKPLPLPPSRRRFIGPLVTIVALAVIVVVVVVLPASWLAKFLPSSVQAEDYSGTLWHGSAGRVRFDGREVGAIEWHLHPSSLLRFKASLDLHWVKVGFVADAAVDVDRQELTAREVVGGGPLEDLQEFGIVPGTSGQLNFRFREVTLVLSGDSPTPKSLIGQLSVANLTSTPLAGNADLGGYTLTFADAAITPDSDASAELKDDGDGPLVTQATVHYSARERTAMLSGTLKERGTVPEGLRAQIDNLSQLHARDTQGRIPVDFEFRL